VRRLIDLTETRVDEECERIYPGRRSGVVEIELKDGRRLEARVLDPKGEGENPMSDADLERKFTANCVPVIGKEKCSAVLDAVWRFDEARELAPLLRLVGA
jgi:2-methylcitrate dehydratase PrpD